MLALDSAAALERLRLGVEPTQGIVDAKGGSVAELELVHLNSGGEARGGGSVES